MRRNQFEIFSDILTVCSEQISKTSIVYKCNLNFTIINKYLKHLEDKKLIRFNENKYIITQSGILLNEQLKSINKILF